MSLTGRQATCEKLVVGYCGLYNPIMFLVFVPILFIAGMLVFFTSAVCKFYNIWEGGRKN